MNLKPRTRLERIVAGQVRSYMNDHPEMFSDRARDPAHRRNVERGIAKRVVPDILAAGLPQTPRG